MQLERNFAHGLECGRTLRSTLETFFFFFSKDSEEGFKG